MIHRVPTLADLFPIDLSRAFGSVTSTFAAPLWSSKSSAEIFAGILKAAELAQSRRAAEEQAILDVLADPISPRLYSMTVGGQRVAVIDLISFGDGL